MEKQVQLLQPTFISLSRGVSLGQCLQNDTIQRHGSWAGQRGTAEVCKAPVCQLWFADGPGCSLDVLSLPNPMCG